MFGAIPDVDLLEELQEVVPLVSDDLERSVLTSQRGGYFATGEASDWDDHFCLGCRVELADLYLLNHRGKI